MEIVKQSHDTKGFAVLPRRWVGSHVARRLNLGGDRHEDLVRHGGERRAALYTRSAHTGISKPGSVEAISAMGNSEEFYRRRADRWRGITGVELAVDGGRTQL
jgi:hypothetical protein